MSENRLNPIVPNGFADHYPYEKWLAIIGNINPTFSDKPTSHDFTPKRRVSPPCLQTQGARHFRHCCCRPRRYRAGRQPAFGRMGPQIGHDLGTIWVWFTLVYHKNGDDLGFMTDIGCGLHWFTIKMVMTWGL